MVAILFPDTNFFVQCREPSELPWSDIATDEEVHLLVCRTVQGEVDRLKGDGKMRRADRARKVSSQFAAIIRENAPLVLRESRPRLLLNFPPRVPPGHVHPESLDMGRNDDRVVAEVLAHITLTKDRAALLTDDTGMMATARAEGLSYIPTPEDWRLPPEKDERDKRIAELQRQVDRLVRAGPVLALSRENNASKPSGAVLLQRTRYEPLADELIGELLSEVRNRFPAKTDFSRDSDPGVAKSEEAAKRVHADVFGIYKWLKAADDSLGAMDWQAPTGEEISKYNDDYAAWLESIRSQLARLHVELPGRVGRAALSWSLENKGATPAESLLVDIETKGELFLLEPPEDHEPQVPPPAPKLPRPPVAPAWRRVPRPGTARHKMTETISRLGELARGYPDVSRAARLFDPGLGLSRPNSERNPRRFYWRRGRGKELTKSWGFECKEFRHGGKPEVFDVVLVVPATVSAMRGAVCFEASARNLPERFEEIVQVAIEDTAGDTEAAARSLVASLHT